MVDAVIEPQELNDLLFASTSREEIIIVDVRELFCKLHVLLCQLSCVTGSHYPRECVPHFEFELGSGQGVV